MGCRCRLRRRRIPCDPRAGLHCQLRQRERLRLLLLWLLLMLWRLWGRLWAGLWLEVRGITSLRRVV